jgi:hypothetical protein
LQKAGRPFLLRLGAENGTKEAARILRDLADELDGLTDEQCGAEVAVQVEAIDGTGSHRRGRHDGPSRSGPWQARDPASGAGLRKCRTGPARGRR